MEDYRKDLEINKHALDDECLRQPMLFAKYSELYTEAIHQRDVAKRKIEEVYSRLDSKYRSQFIEKGAKFTEKVIETLVNSDEGYRQVYKEYLETKKTSETFGNLKESFHQKKSMLELMCKLYLSNYYADIEVKEMEDQAMRGVRKQLQTT